MRLRSLPAASLPIYGAGATGRALAVGAGSGDGEATIDL
jgi:hypothetical protein